MQLFAPLWISCPKSESIYLLQKKAVRILATAGRLNNTAPLFQ